MILRSFSQISRRKPGEKAEVPLSKKVVWLVIRHELPWIWEGSGRGHVISVPSWVGAVKICQLILAIITIVATVQGLKDVMQRIGALYVTSWDGAYGLPLSWATSTWTILYITYLFMSLIFYPKAYNRMVHLFLESLTFLLWVLTSTLLTAHATSLKSFNSDIAAVVLGPSPSRVVTVAHYDTYAQIGTQGWFFQHATFIGVGASAAASGLWAVSWLGVCYWVREHQRRMAVEEMEDEMC